MSATEYAGPILVTCVYFLVYYAMMIIGAKTKTRLFAEYNARGEKFDRYFGKDREMLAADRMMLNMLEHMGPFFGLMWLHAVFVDVTSATIAGSIYVIARIAYPILMGRRVGRNVGAKILFATIPGYLVVFYLLGGLFYAIATG